MKKIVLVLSGPSGAGKSTLIKHLLETLNLVGLTVSCTTRPPRQGEKDGVDYHFISYEKFEKLIQNGEFIEHVSCYGNKYGTLKSAVSDVLKNKDICILDMEFEGAYNILANNLIDFKCIGILVLPPSISTLRNRLKNRNTETKESLEQRLSESFKVDRIAGYNHVIVNKDLEKSKKEMLKVIKEYQNSF